MTILNVTYLAGIAIGPLFAGLANDQLGARFNDRDPRHYAPSFYLAAGCFLAAAVLAYLIAPSRPAPAIAPTAGTMADPAMALAAGENPDAGNDASMSRNALLKAVRTVPWLMLLGFLIFFSVGLIGPYVKNYFMARFGLSESGFGTALLGPALLIGAVSVPLGHVADRWGKTRAIRLGMALCVVALWGIQFSSHKAMVVVLASLLGIGFVLAFPAYMAYLASLAPEGERGALIGAVRLAQGIGALTGAGFASLLHYLHAGNTLVFSTAATLLTAGFLMSLFTVREPKGAPPGETEAPDGGH